jgi:hypothetical protein
MSIDSLNKAVKKLVKAEIAASWKGTLPTTEANDLRAKLRKARSHYANELGELSELLNDNSLDRAAFDEATNPISAAILAGPGGIDHAN